MHVFPYIIQIELVLGSPFKTSLEISPSIHVSVVIIVAVVFIVVAAALGLCGLVF
jgi:hypothetical protein